MGLFERITQSNLIVFADLSSLSLSIYIYIVYSTREELNSYSTPTAERHQLSSEEKLHFHDVKIVKSADVCAFNAYLTLEPLI